MNDYWCIPSKEDADFVACMEDVLDVYELPPCLTDNEASRRTILGAGGVYDGTVHEEEQNIDLERYWITL